MPTNSSEVVEKLGKKKKEEEREVMQYRLQQQRFGSEKVHD